MKYSEYKQLVYSDLYRITGKFTATKLLRFILIGNSFKYIFWMRTCTYTKNNSALKYLIYPFAKIALIHLRYKFGISISPNTKIGSGLSIGHFGGIIINEKCTIGANLTISQGVTLGKSNRGKNKGYPIIGNNVYIGPGAKIIGNIKIGDNVAIGANCVVTKNIPNDSVVVGVPGVVISQEGSEAYISNTNYLGGNNQAEHVVY